METNLPWFIQFHLGFDIEKTSRSFVDVEQLML